MMRIGGNRHIRIISGWYPYDLQGLIDSIGGKEAAEKRLDEMFRRLDASYGDDGFASGNEPSFQIPWIYNWAGLLIRRNK